MRLSLATIAVLIASTAAARSYRLPELPWGSSRREAYARMQAVGSRWDYDFGNGEVRFLTRAGFQTLVFDPPRDRLVGTHEAYRFTGLDPAARRFHALGDSLRRQLGRPDSAGRQALRWRRRRGHETIRLSLDPNAVAAGVGAYYVVISREGPGYATWVRRGLMPTPRVDW
jgi:hypothetical protein